ncbi:unnamed protein product [Durusdinium trenchii]|uniref:PDZ domain-containing protein n=1 Tax=Durusdinium trenchii TaxID=1381693 RepID=A0ABP0SXJ2_9DINO
MALVGPSLDRLQLRHPWRCAPHEPQERSSWQPDKAIGAVLAGIAATQSPGRPRSGPKGLAAKLSKELKGFKLSEEKARKPTKVNKELEEFEKLQNEQLTNSVPEGADKSQSELDNSKLKESWQWLRSKAHKAARQASTVRQHASVLFSKVQQNSQKVQPVKRAKSAWRVIRESWSGTKPRQQLLTFVLAVLLLIAVWPSRSIPQVSGSPEQRMLQLLPEEEARLQMLNDATPGVVYVKGKPALWISEKEEQGAFVPGGTAWIFDNRHVVTSLSNIDQARRGSLKVVLPDRSEVPARVLGVDEGSDLAVLELPAKIALRDALPLGSSAALRLGQDVILIGREATLDMRISKGVVYGLGQPLALSDQPDGHPVQSCIQTDVLMNPINRGGALLNSRGQVIGMAVGPTDEGSVGQAIPADSLRKHIDSIISNGHVTRPSLGMYLAPDGFAEKLGVGGGGVVVQEVIPGSAAKKAGLKAGDIIIAQGDHAVHRMDDLITVLEPFSPGDHFSLTVLRQTAGEGIFAPFSPQVYSKLDLTVKAVASGGI